MGSLQIVLFPSNYLQMAISRAGNIANIRHLPREFSPLVIAECNPPLQAEKTFFHFVFRSPCCPVFIVWSLPLAVIEFSTFSFSLLHVLTSNSCVYSLKNPALPSLCIQDYCMALTSCATLTVYRSTLLKAVTCSHSSSSSSTALFCLPRQLQILLQHLKYKTRINSFDDNTDYYVVKSRTF